MEVSPNIPIPASPDLSKKRTSHACDRCRLMRTKCSGGTRCTRCTKDDAICAYADHKREQTKKDLVHSQSRVRELETEKSALFNALRRVAGTGFNDADVDEEVTSLLAQYADEPAEESSTSRSQPQNVTSHSTISQPWPDDGGERKVPSSIGSPGRQGILTQVVELDQGAGAVGFIGKMSEISWLQRCREYLIQQPGPPTADLEVRQFDQHAANAESLAYFADDANLLAVDEDLIDPLQWPVLEHAVALTEAYFQATDGAIRFISREPFLDTMNTLLGDDRRPSWNERWWLATANLVWAIGLKWLYHAKLDRQIPITEHLHCYARARGLGLDHRISYDHPDVEQIQALGILAFYLLTNGSVTRAWNCVGNAIRHAVTLGLHLEVTDPLMGETEQRRRAKIWFSLYKLQMLIAEITGRPQLIQTAHVTVQLGLAEDSSYNPSPPIIPASDLGPSFVATRASTQFPGQEPTGDARFPNKMAGGSQYWIPYPSASPEFFSYHIRLCQLSEEVADNLYTGPQVVSWRETQSKIGDLQQALDAWMATLPQDLQLEGFKPSHDSSPARLQLAMYSCSVSMMLHRACMCEIRIDEESDRSKDFNLSSARKCVKAAMSMVAFMPEDFAAHKMFLSLPWWTVLHYLCQAGSILLLELCLNNQHFQGESDQVIAAMLKMMSCLACLTEESLSAYKAWTIFRQFLDKVGEKYEDAVLFDTSLHPVPPKLWTNSHHSDLQMDSD